MMLRGFSLVEVAIAVAIIGLMVVSTSMLLQRLPISGREVRDQDLALRIARDKIEILRATGYTSLPESGPFTNILLDSLASSTASVAVTDYNDKTKQVEVSVSWKGDNLVIRSLSLTTLVTQNSTLP
ncbi:MAG: putative membrane protein [Parcubacteria group bacterium GW2011_GWB1_55_9]|nr:MAG: putative membrane protein [Parcubacteria group bacterium GW2011_GWB1_55_9]